MMRGALTVLTSLMSSTAMSPVPVSPESKGTTFHAKAICPPRGENGVGYSSSVIRSLQKFGAEAGKVLYVAKLRESTGRNIMERLASIERGLASLKTNPT